MSGKMKIVIAMLIYGSIGVIVRNINLSAIEIAFLRSCIGSLFLISAGLLLRKIEPSKFMEKGMRVFFISGAVLGINWLFLFKAFEYTTILNAILVYYLAPILVILLSPVVLGEKLTVYKLICALTAVGGLSMIVLSNYNAQTFEVRSFIGIGFALLAAIFYASVILINKRASEAVGIETTITQLVASIIILLPVLVLNNGFYHTVLEASSLWMIVILGVVHTGIAYMLYFSSIKELDGQTVAIFCYIDPISAMVFAWIFLGEPITPVQAIGGVLILGATYFIDRDSKNNLSKRQRVLNE